MTRAFLACLLVVLLLPSAPARAQLGVLTGLSGNPQPSRKQPVTFGADQVQYDQTEQPGHRHRPCGSLAERSRAARRQDRFRPQHRHRCRHRPRRPAGTRRRGDVRRLRRDDAGHERRRAEGHARAAGSRTAGWRPTACGAPPARSTRCRAWSILPAISARRIRPGRPCGRSRPIRGCRTWSTSGTSTTTRCWRCTAGRWLGSHTFRHLIHR